MRWLITLLIALLTTIVLVSAMYLLAAIYLPQDFVSRNRDTFTILGPLGSVILGPAAAIAGAIATVTLAGAALSISRRQAERDATQFLETRSTRVAQLAYDVVRAISEVTVAGYWLWDKSSKIAGELGDSLIAHIETPVQELPGLSKASIQSLLQELAAFQLALRQLRQSLVNLQRDDLAFQYFKASLNERSSALSYIERRLVEEHGFAPNLVRIRHDDVTTIGHFLNLADKLLSEQSFGQLVVSQLIANEILTAHSSSHAALRGLMFTGGLIRVLTEGCKVHTELTVSASHGVAMLVDCYKGVPDGDGIRKMLQAGYPDLVKHGRIAIDLKPQEIVGGEFLLALGELDKRPELLVYERSLGRH